MNYLLMSSVFALAAACGGSQSKPRNPPPHLPVSMEQARASALAAVPGQIAKEELDRERGRWVYEFEILPTSGSPRDVDVDVDATTGAVQIEPN